MILLCGRQQAHRLRSVLAATYDLLRLLHTRFSMIDLPLTLIVELLLDLALSYDSESLLGVELALSDGSRSIVPRGHGNVVVQQSDCWGLRHQLSGPRSQSAWQSSGRSASNTTPNNGDIGVKESPMTGRVPSVNLMCFVMVLVATAMGVSDEATYRRCTLSHRPGKRGAKPRTSPKAVQLAWRSPCLGQDTSPQLSHFHHHHY